MTRESFPGYTPPKGPLVHLVSRIDPDSLHGDGDVIYEFLCGAPDAPSIGATMFEGLVTCEACRRAWREAQEP